MNTNKFSFSRAFELTVLFVIMPLLYVVDVLPVHKVVPLVMLLAYCVIVLLVNKPRNENRFSMIANWTFILFRFIIIAVLVFLAIRFVLHLAFFADLEHNRKLFYMILMYPQIG